MLLLQRVERHLKKSGTPPTKFGREAARDPRLVFDMRRGRQVGPELGARVAAYLSAFESEVRP